MNRPTLDPKRELERWLFLLWANQLADVLEVMTGFRPKTEVEYPAPESEENCKWWHQPLEADRILNAWAGADEPTQRTIGRQIGLAAGLEEPINEDQLKQSYRETIQQAFSAWAAQISQKVQQPLNLVTGAEVDKPELGIDAQVRLNLEGDITARIRLRLGRDLLHWLGQLWPQSEAQEAELPAVPATNRLLEVHPNLRVLLEVELPVKISFGRTHLPLKEVLQLGIGSVVELERSVTDPVELIINNCVIARGEVVVVEGNYGVRIQQIISPEERLRILE